MDYLKYNCYDLAVQNNELLRIGSKLRSLADELAEVLNSLDLQIKKNESLQNSIVAANAAAAEISMRIFSAHSVLDQIVDVYYAAENNTLRLAEELPVGLGKRLTETTISASTIIQSTKISTAAISSGDLILEDWLNKLIYDIEGSKE